MRKSFLAVTLLFFFVFCFAGPLSLSVGASLRTDTFEEILQDIQSYHVDDPNSDVLIQGSIDGMIDSLNDPYTEYLSPEQLNEFYVALDNKYFGVGIQLQESEHFPVVYAVFKNSPAERAGILPNDQVMQIDGIDVADEPLDKIVESIRGREGTKVKLTFRRSGADDFELELVRTNISVPTVFSEVLDDGTGYIFISQFGFATADEFADALTVLKQQGATNLIMDLRGNPGGILDEAVRITGAFVGPNLLAGSIMDKNGEREEYRTTEQAAVAGMPTAVLIDGNSASASEFLAGSLQDYQAAVLVGATTYGKGSVQTVLPLSSGGALKLTVARYYTPNNRVINGVGLTPDYQVLTPVLQLTAAQRLLNPQGNKNNMISFDMEKSQVSVNEKLLPVNQTVLQNNGGVYLPLRLTFEALGYKVDWQDIDNSVKITGYDADAIFSLEDGQTIVNGNAITNAAPLKIEDNTLFIPLASLSLLGIHSELSGNILSVEKN